MEEGPTNGTRIRLLGPFAQALVVQIMATGGEQCDGELGLNFLGRGGGDRGCQGFQTHGALVGLHGGISKGLCDVEHECRKEDLIEGGERAKRGSS